MLTLMIAIIIQLWWKAHKDTVDKLWVDIAMCQPQWECANIIGNVQYNSRSANQ